MEQGSITPWTVGCGMGGARVYNSMHCLGSGWSKGL